MEILFTSLIPITAEAHMHEDPAYSKEEEKYLILA